jgi:putative addiction module killer protein
MPKKRKATKKPAMERPADESEATLGQLLTLRALVLENGSCPIEEWIRGIRDTTTKQRIQNRFDRIERGALGDCKSVGDGVSELRLDFGPGYRIYYATVGTSLIVLVAGGDKSSQSADIQTAKQYWKDYKDDPERYERDFRR